MQVDRFLLLFLVQQDLGVQWQREMNYDRVDNARSIQKKKAQVSSHLCAILLLPAWVRCPRVFIGTLWLCAQIEQAVEHQLFSRASFFKDAAQASDSMDALAQAVTLQSRLNEAVEQQDFSLAATLRDELQAAKACPYQSALLARNVCLCTQYVYLKVRRLLFSI